MTAHPRLRDKLRDPIWQVAIGIVALLLTAVGIWLGWQALSSKGVAYEIVSQAPLVSSQETLAGKLQVSFDGKPVEDVSLVVLRVYNSGNEEIRKADYESPITFSFGQGADVLSAEVVSTQPAGIPASLTRQGNSVVLSPVLLNSNDIIELRAVVSRVQGNIVASCRIAGVSNCILVASSRPNYWINIILGVVLGTVISALLDRYRTGRKALKEVKVWEAFGKEQLERMRSWEAERAKRNAEIAGQLEKQDAELKAQLEKIEQAQIVLGQEATHSEPPLTTK